MDKWFAGIPYQHQLFKFIRVHNGVVFEHNSILSKDYNIIYCNGDIPISAINNFWNTTDTSIIDLMIIDKNDYYGYRHYIEYKPFLIKPHPKTPHYDFGFFPVVKAGKNKSVYETFSVRGLTAQIPLIQIMVLNLVDGNKHLEVQLN
jgi:hypothetical protein